MKRYSTNDKEAIVRCRMPLNPVSVSTLRRAILVCYFNPNPNKPPRMVAKLAIPI
jgi:hypothetical protein